MQCLQAQTVINLPCGINHVRCVLHAELAEQVLLALLQPFQVQSPERQAPDPS